VTLYMMSDASMFRWQRINKPRVYSHTQVNPIATGIGNICVWCVCVRCV